MLEGRCERIQRRSAIIASTQTVSLIALREYGGVGPRGFQQLITHFGTLEGIFDSHAGEIASLNRMTPEREEQIKSSMDNATLIEARIEEYAQRGINVATVFDSDYPEMLLDLADPPPYFYWRGRLDATIVNAVAIVGSHEASVEGIAEAVRLGKALAGAGVVVVSGLARGIDGGAHVGALQAEGRTIAVLGSGIDEVYPPEHHSLAESIAESGLVISEYSPESEVNAGQLIARNRLIVGLAKSVIVVEVTSGTGGTASAIKETINQGKALFTCFNPNVTGAATNSLGAVHLVGADDWQMVVRYLV